MTLQLIYITTLILFLFFLNFFLEKFNLLIHSRFKEEHKKFGQDKIPLSGGVFFCHFKFFNN